jgi:hypothetical protein
MAYFLGSRGRSGLLGLSAYLLLALPNHLGCSWHGGGNNGCGGDDCFHDWECGGSSICIPYEARYQCFQAPVCESDDECDEDEPCMLRGQRIVDEGTRDPFTSDAPAKRTCGGYAGPAEHADSGCGSGGDPDDGTGGTGWTTSSTTTKSSSTSSTGGGGAGGAGGAGGSGTGGAGGAGGSGGSGTGGAGGGGVGGAGGTSGGGGA